MADYGASPLKRIRNAKVLMETAQGLQKADKAIINAKLLNVYTGELLENMVIGIKGEWIAYVGRNPEGITGRETVIIDAENKTVIPGLIDGHTHIVTPLSISEFLNHAMIGGTTTIITETLEIYPTMGLQGVIDFLESFRDQPIKVFGTAPAMVSISNQTHGISVEDLQQLLARDDIVGLGESYWQSVLLEPEQMLAEIGETLLARKSVEGHTAGAREGKLMAYISTGVSSCHEPTNAEEVIDLLRLGLYVMIREGSIRRDLEAISSIKDSNVDLRRAILATDGIDPNGLLEKGYMEYLVQKAIDLGFSPVSAVQMATLNVAEHFSLDGIIGGIAPGKYADMLIIPEINVIKPECVISKGRVIAEHGKIMVPARQHVYPSRNSNSVRFPEKKKASDFCIHTPDAATEMNVRIIELITDLVTKESVTAVPVSNNKIAADPGHDIIKIAAIDRTHLPGKMFVGLIKGFGLRSGALASSAAWDTSDIIVVGADDTDMAEAVNRIYEIQGGTVACAGGKILAELPLPIFGISSDLPFETVILRQNELKLEAAKLGAHFDDPYLTLVTLTGAAIPFLRICEEGLVNFKSGKTMGLFVS